MFPKMFPNRTLLTKVLVAALVALAMVASSVTSLEIATPSEEAPFEAPLATPLEPISGPVPPSGPRFERALLQDSVGGGSPGRDFPTLSAVPPTDFTCHGRGPGYYADEEFGCQVFHICHTDRRKDSFLCPNGTIFHQLRLVCDWWYNVDCSTSDLHVSVNNDIGRTSSPIRNDIKPSNPKKTSFTNLSNFAEDQQTPSRSENDIKSNPSRNDFSGAGFGIPLVRTNQNSARRTSNALPAVIAKERPGRTQTINFPQESPRQRDGVFTTVTPRSRIPLPTASRSTQNNRNDIKPSNPKKPSFTNLSNFAEDQQTPSRSENDINSNPSQNDFSGAGFGIPLVRTNQNNARRTSNALPAVIAKERPGRTQTFDFPQESPRPRDRVFTTVTPRSGIPLPTASRSTQNNRNSFTVTTESPFRPQIPEISDHFSVPKPRISPPSSNNINNNNVDRGSTNRNAPAKRVTINRRPVTNQVSRTRTTPSGSSSPFGIPLPKQPTKIRPTSRPNTVREQQLTSFNRGDHKLILNDEKLSNQFFNIGSPRVVSNNIGRPLPPPSGQRNNINNLERTNVGVSFPPPNVQTNRNIGTRTRTRVTLPPSISQSNTNFGTRTSAGVTLPQPNTQSNRNFGTRSNIGVTLPPANVQSNINFRTRTNVRVTLPPANVQSNRNTGSRNNVGVPLSSVNTQSNRNTGARTSIGVPLPPVNVQSNRNTGARTNIGVPLPPINVPQNNLVRNPNVNRGQARFTTSQKNRARVNQGGNNQNRHFTIVRDFDDDFDDLNDSFDDDRFDFDDDRFDNDRFDNNRFDDDRFDDDRFDDDRFDDDRFDDDRFDDDRFDNDRFDDDRFDDDRFDGDRFDDDLDDRFDNDPFDDDRFDFDDDDDDFFDDRRVRFGNGNGFNFGRRARGSTFSSHGVNQGATTKKVDTGVKIKPPSEIQLPPPPL